MDTDPRMKFTAHAPEGAGALVVADQWSRPPGWTVKGVTGRQGEAGERHGRIDQA
jgi:hypothetical protein